MRAAILSIGSELMEGRIADTNAAFLSSELTTLGFRMVRHTAVGDRRDDLLAVLADLSRVADVVIATGGIGPTPDDPTRQAVAELCGFELAEDPRAAQHIRDLFARRNTVPPPSNFIQACIPVGGEMIHNPTGTAAGFSVRYGECLIFVLPGVPSEMKIMFRESIAPRLRAMSNESIAVKSLMTFGMGESIIGDKLHDMMQECHNPRAATQALEGVVTVRLTATCADKTSAKRLLDEAEAEARKRLGDAVYGEEGQSLADVVVEQLARQGLKVAVAESCTGGMIASQITDVPGASRCFLEGTVTYSNESKTCRLGVPEELIARHGAVSAEVAGAMAEGMRLNSGADVTLASTGIAGPGGATTTKPVGLVYIALADAAGVKVEETRTFGDRRQIKDRSAKRALNLLRLYLEEQGRNHG